jgi:hypothetical protein
MVRRVKKTGRKAANATQRRMLPEWKVRGLLILVWRYRCDAEWHAAAENKVDEEGRGRDTL